MAVLTMVVSDVEMALVPGWSEVASRAHAILSQSLPDELLDAGGCAGAHRTPFRLPPVLFG
jgi:hypothetical protein